MRDTATCAGASTLSQKLLDNSVSLTGSNSSWAPSPTLVLLGARGRFPDEP